MTPPPLWEALQQKTRRIPDASTAQIMWTMQSIIVAAGCLRPSQNLSLFNLPNVLSTMLVKTCSSCRASLHWCNCKFGVTQNRNEAWVLLGFLGSSWALRLSVGPTLQPVVTLTHVYFVFRESVCESLGSDDSH